MVRFARSSSEMQSSWLDNSPNQVLTHAARAAAKQLNNFSHSVAARGKREGPLSGQVTVCDHLIKFPSCMCIQPCQLPGSLGFVVKT